MTALKSACTRVDAALDHFWRGIVLRGYHQAQAIRFSRMAERLASETAKHPELDYVSHQARRHELEADLLQSKA